jgi:formamidopyrimidine-DNA glycosylase
MPELPDLEVIREVLAPKLVGAVIVRAEVLRPIVVRSMVGVDPCEVLAGRAVERVARRGKFLMLGLDGGLSIVINPMLAGRLRFGVPLERNRVRDAFALRFADGNELRFHDQKDMGKIYLTADLDAVPTYAALGPEANDPALDLAQFVARLRPHRGEIKGVLTDQTFVAGIGNAYADEILWAARIYPFRRRTGLASPEIASLHAAVGQVLSDAIRTLRDRVGSAIEVEVRDFLSVHGRPGQPCPRCDGAISEVSLRGRDTHFCRTCQPGIMIEKARKLER